MWLVHVSSRIVNKRNITGEQEEMDTDVEEDSEENGWTCDIRVFLQQCF
jgi:hypothetical protein